MEAPGPISGASTLLQVWVARYVSDFGVITVQCADNTSEEESMASDSLLAVEVGSKADVLPPRFCVRLKELFQRQRLREGVFAREGRSRDGHGREIRWRGWGTRLRAMIGYQ